MLKLISTKLIVYDFDGVMTDNRVYIDQEGKEMVQVNRSDGLGIAEIKKLGIKQIILSTETNPVVSRRAEKLGIKCIQGIENKKEALTEYCMKHNIQLMDVAFVGNDINDKEAMIIAGNSFCPADAHLVKLGTMGEYGQPNVDIPEGFFEVEYRGRKDTMLFPRQAGSWYHQTKVHDTNNTVFACKIWGLSSTDIMQGVVYGTQFDEMGNEDPRLRTRLDFDECFGTAINRFSCQAAVGEPLTPFGKGNQKRGYLPLRDSMQCLTLALVNPPSKGEYRTFNQFEDTYIVYELAEKVKKVANELGLNAEIHRIENPRIEKEEHYYNPDHQHLLDLGYKPTHDMETELKPMLEDLVNNRERILEVKDVLIPEIWWDGSKHRSKLID